MKKVAVLTLLVMSLALAGALQAQAPVPVGDEFQVNSYTTSFQQNAAVAADAEGNFVVAWRSEGSYGTDTSSFSVQAQLYDADGTPVGDEFQVNSYTTDNQSGAAVAMDSLGNFVVVWGSDGSYGTDTSSFSVQAQLYDADGVPVGGEFQVNSYTTDNQSGAAVAMDSLGNFVVVWGSDGSYGTDTSSFSVQAQLYDADGVPVGGEFQVNTYTTGGQLQAGVASDPLGNFVVVWRSPGSDVPTWTTIQAQRHSSNGTPVGDQFQVSSFTTWYSQSPEVASDALGNFVVVWDGRGSYGTDDSAQTVQGRRYDSAGSAVGSQFQVNSYTTSRQESPSIAFESDGGSVVVWQSFGSFGTDASQYSVQVQRYGADGAPVGGEFQVNSYTTNSQVHPAVAADAEGNFVVAWHSDEGSYGTDDDRTSIQGQRFSVPIFANGFESGDTSAWSSTVQ